jgi:hypothetical protein
MAMTHRQQHWLRLSRKWSRSGVSQREFCEQHGVSFGSFAWWRCELRRRGVLDGRRRLDDRSVPGRGDGAFLPVTLVPPRRDEPTDRRAIEIVIDDRRVVRVHCDFDPVMLRRVVSALEDNSC